jgi:putative hydrolase of the HAD superfamily
MIEVYRSHRPKLSLLPDARAFLDRYQGKRACAVVTDGPAASQRAKVEALGLERWVAHVVVTAEHGPSYYKPSEQPFAFVSDAVGVAGEECLYIGDNPLKDFAGPKKLGWQTIRIRRAGGLHYARPSGGEVDRVVSSFDDISLG